MTQRGFLTAELREEHQRGVPNAFSRLETLIHSLLATRRKRADPRRRAR